MKEFIDRNFFARAWESKRKRKDYEYARVWQNGQLLIEGKISTIELQGENEFSVYFRDDNEELIEVGIISKFGIAIIKGK